MSNVVEEISGLFGCHITVKNHMDGKTPSSEQVERFSKLCREELKCKPVLVLYPSEDNYPVESIRNRPQELMSSSYHSGKKSDVLKHILGMADTIKNNGFELLRVKLEAMANCKNIEKNLSSDSSSGNDMKYFEYHTKIYLRGQDRVAQLAHLDSLLIKEEVARSQNLLGKHYDICGHLLTFRWFSPTPKEECDTFHKEFLAKLKTHFENGGGEIEIAESEKEFAVYDSNILVDQGWVRISP
ncbi:hypothetical protein NAEGRDRAFT_81258 [Naegleria gruberi]|uniref:Uncharacterized protein n=1 Tax=Naegleria gruberi TaxID=5762 RepID=D2VUD9_NAEGR|nr:uncharacterized protein NAEGRDRAFT_81258 [Naegleria gruberi]EFC39676.1 hypothetical protein NAEGRDRAFT_81258 [Naegleria gruberi]|eukprot:XP_002672420.1 hypothetical protein NAEGRDRAFT_81258 [Naegleria gruberi strain NEG-M]